MYSQLIFLDFLRLNIQVMLPSKPHPLFFLAIGSQFPVCCVVEPILKKIQYQQSCFENISAIYDFAAFDW